MSGERPENRLEAAFCGRAVRFRRQNALDQLAQRALAEGLLPALRKNGVPQREAWALAQNCALLSQTLCGADAVKSPEQVLRRFDAGQIAALCESYFREAAWEERGGDFDGEEGRDV